ncbi:hypothetical protein NLJ89_g10176 [Agrocybe chaxingu]|uniref:DUF6533 domain-containing protein n=1 Tax=Agrocybe chaxingu TaxID=84603 RepID=A0A9W8JZ68_9AGAR|nr:hypothetical protein NLJ89_g10176 [Agrocybe chaxingu]
MSSVRLGRAVLFASLAVMTYDYLCTLEKEVNYVWKQPFTMGCLLFYVNRYLPFVVLMLAISIMFPNVDPEACYVRFKVICCLVMLSFIVSQVEPIRVDADSQGCRVTAASNLIAVPYLLILISETVVVVLTLYDTPIRHGYISCINKARSDAAVVLLTPDNLYTSSGLLFYGYMFVITVSNTIYPFVVPSHQKNNLAM